MLGWTEDIEDLLNYYNIKIKELCWKEVLDLIKSKRNMKILDLATGRCWAAYGFALLGYKTIAVDINTDKVAGLGADINLIRNKKVYFYRVASDDAIKYI